MKRSASQTDVGATEPKQRKTRTKEPILCDLMRSVVTQIWRATYAVPGECQARGSMRRHYSLWHQSARKALHISWPEHWEFQVAHIWGNLPAIIIGDTALQLPPVPDMQHVFKQMKKTGSNKAARLLSGRTMHVAFRLPNDVAAIERKEHIDVVVPNDILATELTCLPAEEKEKLTPEDIWTPALARDFLWEHAVHSSLVLLGAYAEGTTVDAVFQTQMMIQPRDENTLMFSLKTAAVIDPYMTIYAAKYAPQIYYSKLAPLMQGIRRLELEKVEEEEPMHIKADAKRYRLTRPRIPLIAKLCTSSC